MFGIWFVWYLGMIGIWPLVVLRDWLEVGLCLWWLCEMIGIWSLCVVVLKDGAESDFFVYGLEE